LSADNPRGPLADKKQKKLFAVNLREGTVKKKGRTVKHAAQKVGVSAEGGAEFHKSQYRSRGEGLCTALPR